MQTEAYTYEPKIKDRSKLNIEEKEVQPKLNFEISSASGSVRIKQYASNSTEYNREKIKILLREKGQTPEEIEKNVDKLYRLADVFFDLWLESKNDNEYE